jgi:hypothetical protein
MLIAEMEAAVSVTFNLMHDGKSIQLNVRTYAFDAL